MYELLMIAFQIAAMIFMLRGLADVAKKAPDAKGLAYVGLSIQALINLVFIALLVKL